MQILWWIAILSAATCVQASPLTKVIGGQITEPTEFPFIVSVQRRSFSSWSHLCAGTVYNELWIISNAHCLESSIGAFSLRVDAGEWNFALPSGSEQLREVAEIIIHPEYDPTSLENDLALIRLSQPLDFGDGTVRPIALPTSYQDPPVGTNATVVGWGLLAADGLLQDRLHKAEVVVVDDTSCDAAYQAGGFIRASMLCAGVAEGGVGVCQGDYGGPLVSAGKPNVLLGVVSWGYPGCAVAGYPDVYTQVSYFVNWIRSTVYGTQ